MRPEANPYNLPAVLLIDDIARALRTSVRTVRRGLQLGTFPIHPMTSPRASIGIDKRYRWARADVEHFLAGGFQAFDRRNVRLRHSA